MSRTRDGITWVGGPVPTALDGGSDISPARMTFFARQLALVRGRRVRRRGPFGRSGHPWADIQIAACCPDFDLGTVKTLGPLLETDRKLDIFRQPISTEILYANDIVHHPLMQCIHSIRYPLVHSLNSWTRRQTKPWTPAPPDARTLGGLASRHPSCRCTNREHGTFRSLCWQSRRTGLSTDALDTSQRAVALTLQTARRRAGYRGVEWNAEVRHPVTVQILG